MKASVKTENRKFAIMTDRFEIIIKRLLDEIPQAYARVVHDGEYVSEGYKPDRIYIYGKETWVIEIESSTSRKGFIGGYLKAQKYFEDNELSNGNVMFIINHNKRNLDAVGRQISQYHSWLKGHQVDVKPTYLIYDTDLSNLTDDQENIFSSQYLKDSAVIID